MGFWDNLARDVQAQRAQQQPQPEQAVAPGAWWQQGAARAQPQPQQYQQPQQQSKRDDLCPRCGSEDYMDFQMDVSYGGTVPPQVGATRKQCFDCRYPMYNATGDLISGRGIQAGTKVAAKQVRQLGGGQTGSWQGSATWDRAMPIPGS